MAGGLKSNLTDHALFRVLKLIHDLRASRDMVEHTRIGDWYSRIENVGGESSRIKS